MKLEPQMLINYLIKEIVLYNDHIEIHYNSPLKISPVDDTDFIEAVKNYLKFDIEIHSFSFASEIGETCFITFY